MNGIEHSERVEVGSEIDEADPAFAEGSIASLTLAIGTNPVRRRAPDDERPDAFEQFEFVVITGTVVYSYPHAEEDYRGFCVN